MRLINKYKFIRMLMRKNFTSAYSNFINQSAKAVSAEMNPSQETVKNILRFAAAYRVEIMPKEQHIEYFLN